MVALAAPSLQQACGTFQPHLVLLMRRSVTLRRHTQSQTSSTALWHRWHIASLSALAGAEPGGTCPRDYLMAEPRVPAKARLRGCARGCPQGFPRRGCPPLSARRLSDSLSVGLTASLSAGQHKSSASQLDSAARQSSSTTQHDRAPCSTRLCRRQAWPRALDREPGSACPAERTVVEGAADQLHCLPVTDSSSSRTVSVRAVPG